MECAEPGIVSEVDIKYFQDTDTLLIEFSERKTVETQDAGEDILIELDAEGKTVSLTIDRAGEHIDVSNLSYEGIPV